MRLPDPDDAAVVMREGIAEARVWMRRNDLPRAVAALETTSLQLTQLAKRLTQGETAPVTTPGPTLPVAGSFLDFLGARVHRRHFDDHNRASGLVIPPPV